jgi:acetyltransferase-like isoleucine patch superfamily enzyme
MRAPERINPYVRAASSAASSLLHAASKASRAIRGYATAGRFAGYGKNFDFDPDGMYSYETITVGDNVTLGVRPTLLATRSTIRIGNNVMFGPGVTVRGGNHRFDVVGTPIRAITDEMKRPEDDPGVVIEDDVWVGGGATILGGVTVGRGSVIGGSAVVTKDVPPYSIAVGNPARVVKQRFGVEDILEHENILYPSH